MSEPIPCLHLLMGRAPQSALPLARDSIGRNDWLVLMDSAATERAFTKGLEDLAPDVTIRQTIDSNQESPPYIGDADLARIVCESKQVLSWW